MSHQSQKTVFGTEPASRLGQWSWAFFDWANQPYFTIITTAIFAPYFARGFVGDVVEGQKVYAMSVAIAGVIIALTAPVLGAVADAGGRRKPWIAFLSIPFVIAVCLLWTAMPGAPDGIWSIFFALIIASVTMETAVVFNHAMLPGVAPANRLGWLSGLGWGVGYFGAIVALLLLLWCLFLPGREGIPHLPFVPEAPLFGLDPAMSEPERFTAPFAAIWYVIFVIPMFLFTPDVAGSRKNLGPAVIEGLKSLAATLRKIRKISNVMRFLIGRMIYNDGLSAVFAFGGIYGAATFGWQSFELLILSLVILVFAGIGAVLGGFIDDFLGSKRAIVLSVGVLVIGALGSASVRDASILFVIPTESANATPGLFSTLPELVYLCFGCIMGLGMGPTQSASRTMMARLAPEKMITEFFGLYAISGKATAFLAPTLIAMLTVLLEDVYASLLVIVALLTIGLIIILPVREERTVL